MPELRENTVYVRTSISLVDSQSAVMAQVLFFSFEVSGFKLKSLYKFHFQTNTIGKDMNALIFQNG